MDRYNWEFVFSAVRRGGYSSAQISEYLAVSHVVACELIYRAQRVMLKRKPVKERPLASRRLAYLSEE